MLFRNKIKVTRKILLLVSSGKKELTVDEIGEINDSIQNETGHCSDIYMSVSEDLTLEDAIGVTILATGF